jgi:hypothetical protein
MCATPTLGTTVLTPDGAGEVIAIEPTISADIDIFHVNAATGLAAYYADEMIVLQSTAS